MKWESEARRKRNSIDFEWWWRKGEKILTVPIIGNYRVFVSRTAAVVRQLPEPRTRKPGKPCNKHGGAADIRRKEFPPHFGHASDLTSDKPTRWQATKSELSQNSNSLIKKAQSKSDKENIVGFKC